MQVEPFNIADALVPADQTCVAIEWNGRNANAMANGHHAQHAPPSLIVAFLAMMFMGLLVTRLVGDLRSADMYTSWSENTSRQNGVPAFSPTEKDHL